MGVVLAVILLFAGSLSGADLTPPKPETKPATPTQTPPNDASIADRAWQALEALRLPADPEEWSKRTPTEDEQREHQQKQADFACRASDLAKDFYTRFPNHDMAPVAKAREREFLEPFKMQVLEYRASRFEDEAEKSPHQDRAQVLAEIEKNIREMLASFPDHFVPHQKLLAIARHSEPAKARALAEEVRDKKGALDFVKSEANEILRKLDRIGKPFVLKFTASDGRQVDLEQLKGKVVLIDFWATWCVPCVAELPVVKTTYDHLHPQGFEIVGISLDQDKQALERFLKKSAMPWPQFFDGGGFKNKLARQFEIGSIPTLWLVDKSGLLRDLQARESLEDKARKLLSE
jgi:thiol-disulfide isomerase/thioredoxin